EGHLRAAAVLAGAALEEQLRRLVETRPELSAVSQRLTPRMLNAELRRVNVYGDDDHRMIDAWQRARNQAAHAEVSFDTYSSDDIKQLVAGVRAFVEKYRAAYPT